MGMKIYLALDHDDEVQQQPRIAMQDVPFDPALMSEGYKLREQSWEYRETEIDEETWHALLRGELEPNEQDALHYTLWSQAEPVT
jgi:hypothetical protein